MGILKDKEMETEKKTIKEEQCESCRMVLPGNKVFSCSAGSFKWLVVLGAIIILASVSAAGYFGYRLYQFRSEQSAFAEYQLHKEQEQAALQKMLNDNEKMLRDMTELANLEKKLRRTLIRDVDNSKLAGGAEATPEAAESVRYLGQGGPKEKLGTSELKALLEVQNQNISQMIAERKSSVSELLQVIGGRSGTMAAFPDKWPVQGGEISSPYGSRVGPIEGGYEWHQGIDIAVDFGAPVYASAAGKVEQAGWNGGYGRYVRINHGNGYESAYGHMSSLAVEAGQRVAKGEIIGFVGSSGYSTGPHIHYEVLVDGQAVDPYYMLKSKE